MQTADAECSSLVCRLVADLGSVHTTRTNGPYLRAVCTGRVCTDLYSRALAFLLGVFVARARARAACTTQAAIKLATHDLS